MKLQLAWCNVVSEVNKAGIRIPTKRRSIGTHAHKINNKKKQLNK